MASYNELNALIDAYINRNGVQAITGQILNGVLKAMVEQLGRGYTIMGAAIPTTDPGTPDGPECYFASETGTYTDFDGLQVAPGELALLCYTPSDGWTKATIYEGFQTVEATIDGNVGTPSVGVSYADGVLSFDFHNMKGNPGQNGQDGASAGFGTIGADITGGVGTPGVTVESSGPATAKNLQFHFTNLKGETGVTSVVATVDNTTGTPTCTVSLVGQQLTLAFSGLKGAQGDTGVSADYPIAIVNNLTTNDPASALSAAQGVVLDGKVTQLEAKVDGYSFSDAFTISATGEHSSKSDRITFPTPILPGDYTFLVETGTTGNSGSVGLFARKVGAGSNTNIGSTPIGTPKNITLTDAIESLGIYMSSTVNTHTGTMPLTIITQTSIDQRIDEVEKDKEYILNNYFVGKGGTYNSTKLYGLKKGVQYRIVLQNPANLTDTTSDTSVAKFDAKYEKTNGTLTNLVRVAIGSGNVLDSYTFTIGNDYKDNGFVEIGGRAVAGTIVNFSIVEEKANEYTTYGVVRCSTAEGTAQKDVTIPGLINVNTEKIRFVLIFSKVTTISATLSINGDAAKALYYNGARANSNNSWSAGEKLDVVYNANYPGYFATTITNLTHTINADSPSKEKTVSEKGIVDYVAGRTNDSVKDFNLDKESGIVSAASRSPLVYEKTNDEQCPVFSVLTDLHSDLPRFKRACEFADLEDPILATLCLGDLINTSNAQNPYPLILDYTKPVISITGNHEVLKKTGQGITGWSETDIIDNMYNPTQVAHNGETHPADKCYWYKDFTKTVDNTTKKLRVIGLHQYESSGTGEQNSGAGKDVCYYTQGQIDWLIERLNEVDSNTWVMILIHYAPTASMTRIECPFTPSSSFNFPLQGGSNTGGPSSMSDDEFIPKIVQAWIDGTTLNISCDITVGETTTTITAVKGTAFSAHTKKFVGYFSGHTHRDFVGKLTNYQKQLQFAFITTSAVSTQQSCDIGRSTSGRSQDCFTVVGVDWFKNSVSLIRIGADITTDMRERKWYNIPIPE